MLNLIQLITTIILVGGESIRYFIEVLFYHNADLSFSFEKSSVMVHSCFVQRIPVWFKRIWQGRKIAERRITPAHA